jgi:hypothetical protein
MNDALENFLSEHFPITGLAAFTVQSQNRAPLTHSFIKSLEPAVAEQVLIGLLQSVRTLAAAEQGASRCCWTFECLRVYAAARPDGACLAVLILDDVNLDRERLQQGIQGFLELEEI